MYEENRGTIKYLERYKQLISYEGLERHRKITPTDIDGLIDYGGNAFILIEGKYGDKQIDKGQKMAIENLINTIEDAGKKACCLLFRHLCEPNEIIVARDCVVSDVYYERKWHYYNTHPVIYYIQEFEKHWRSKGIYL